MENLTRYDWDNGSDLGGRGIGMHEATYGRYVKFSDVEALLSTSTNISRDAIALQDKIFDIVSEGINKKLGAACITERINAVIAQQHPC